MHTSSVPRTPIWAPQQAPHVGGPIIAPDSIKMSTSPSLIAFTYIDCAAGSISVLTLTFFPFSIFAALLRSDNLAPVQEPIYALSISVDSISLATTTFSGEYGFATDGSILSHSYSIISQNLASISPL